MSITEVVSKLEARFNYLAVLDLIVFVCIFVIANRPDGLAITVSALILGVGVLIFRCTMGVKSYLARASRRKAAPRFDQRVRSTAAPAVPVPAKPSSKSWLRDSE